MTPPQSGRLAQAGWALLPLRAFLAIVFLNAGISKIADPRFLDGRSPTSMHQTVLAVRAGSPIGSWLGPVVDHSFGFGIAMALGEIAVGLGLLAGLFTRVAAAGGMLLALSLWLTVSWGAQPWFTSADVAYLFALTPLAIAGTAGVLSVDAWLEMARQRRPSRTEDSARRTLVTVGAVVIGGLVVGGSSLFRRSVSPVVQTGSRGSVTTSAAGAGEVLAKAADVPVGGGIQVTDADSGDALWILQLAAGQFTAFNAACPHQGCPVRFVSPASGFACPCHGSAFDSKGKVLLGPARRNLSAVPVASDGTQIRRT